MSEIVNHPLVAIVGPNASGKSALAVKLARQFNGEVISADSRQVYRGLDIGSGKISKKEMRGVPHHLLDVANPRHTFTVADYQRQATSAIKKIWQRGKLPILCGGTGFYISAVLSGTVLPQVKPNPRLRKIFTQKTTKELFEMLKKSDLARDMKIDKHNRVRLIRSLEIVKSLGKVPKLNHKPLSADVLILGLSVTKPILINRIERRLRLRLKQGLVNEVKKLHLSGLSWRRLESFGLEYRAVALYLQGKFTKQEMLETINRESWQYARRQMTWFKKNTDATWVSRETPALRLTRQFLSKKIAHA